MTYFFAGGIESFFSASVMMVVAYFLLEFSNCSVLALIHELANSIIIG
jgi:hypothetical protein